ncbi:unnamed protein product [Candidula unifasciata]|uniref:Uncharacterized protein n=1 Tax=Candidula unifasciata TaxID=100452 RepID=A0A8S3ZVP3_9EUPU|nr:unnamed protein product [Candidula unifasciata]
MDKLTAKLITLAVLIVLTVIFSVIPYFLVLRGSRSLVPNRRRDKVIAALNCFGGGVFLGTLLLHLMIEGSAEFDAYKSKAGWKTEFPLFNIFVAGGFFAVAFIEYFMHSRLHNRKSGKVNCSPSAEQSQEPGGVSEGQYGAVGGQGKPLESRARCPTLNQKADNAEFGHHESDSLLPGRHHHNHYESAAVKADCVAADGNSRSKVTDTNSQGKHGHQNCDIEVIHSDPVTIGSESVTGISEIIAEIPDGLRAFLLLFALSFHTIFDGLAVGLQDSISAIWQVFTAIAIHKSIIAFCLGLELFKCHPDQPWRAFSWICFFSLMSPIGIGLGIGLTSGGIDDLARLLSSSILQGLAAGTFLYVTFLEILSLYIGHNCHRHFLHVFFALVGFAFMACVKTMDNND